MGQKILFAGRSVLVLGLLFGSLLDAQDLRSSSIDSSVHFQLVSDFLLVVKGRVGELDGLKFILDTGATYTLIDRKLAERLQLKRSPGKITNFDREVPVDWAVIPDLRLGPLQTGPFRVQVAKLGEFSKLAEGVDGIIGLDLLSRSKKFFIDYEKQTVAWELGEEGQERRGSPTYFAIPFSVQGSQMHLIIDTGFQGILLYKDRLHKSVPELRTEGEATEVEFGRLQTTQVKLPGVRMFGVEKVATVFLADGPNAGDLPGVDGYLGVASLNAKRVEFDFADRILRWR
ncbi:MAG TPA: retropepsin-like aspartic protease [Candidatus Acidoferrum sp.]|nr:retropepsin-like aspartic protease [Candidatus Acidoferrum sp.]